jgi:hypothetical protein
MIFVGKNVQGWKAVSIDKIISVDSILMILPLKVFWQFRT